MKRFRSSNSRPQHAINRRPIANTVAAAVAVAIAGNTAMAQEAGLEEVIVTATKRSENLQLVPVSVTAISGARLTELGVTNVLSLERAAVGLHINNKGNDPTIIMRGAGSAGTQDLAVPIYVDGMYRPRAGQALASYFDVERVEVLRGPQGTLFGRNTLGGLVNIIQNKPDTRELRYGGALTLGGYDLQRFEGFVNVPFSDTAALRVTGSRTKQDPFVENSFNPSAGLKDADETYGRVQFRWAPNENFEMTLAGAYWKDTANGNSDYAYKVLGIPWNPTTRQTNGVTGVIDPRQGTRVSTPGFPCTGGDGPGGRSQAGNVCLGQTSALAIADPYTVAWDFQPIRNIREDSYSAEFKWNLGFASWRTNVSKFDYSELRETDTDLSSRPALVAGQRIESTATQIDTNLNSNGEGKLDWTLGAYYFDDSSSGNNSAFLWGYTYTTPQKPAWATWLYQPNGGTKSTALYGQAEYALTDAFHVTAGLRYSNDKRESITKSVNPTTLNNELPSYVVGPMAVQIKGDESHVDYRIAGRYEFSDNVMAYASASTGYIAGGIQQGNTGKLLDATEVDAYEIGLKSTLLDGRLRVNTAAYYNKYKGLTTTVFITQGAAGTILAQTVPGGSLNSKGLELDMEWAATDKLRVNLGLAHDNSRFDKFNVGNQFTEGSDVIVGGQGYFVMDGKKARFSPDLSGNLGLTYAFELGDRGKLVPGLSARFSSSYKTSNAPYFWSNQDAYSLVDASVTWYSAGKDFVVRAFVNNATEEAILTESTVFSRSRAMVDYSEPRQWGVRMSYRF